MNMSQNTSHTSYGFSDSDPELGMYDFRVFWLAALVAMLMVLAVAYFKMGY